MPPPLTRTAIFPTIASQGALAMVSALLALVLPACGTGLKTAAAVGDAGAEGPLPAAETREQAEKRGLDYERTLRHARSGERKALIDLLRLTADLAGAATADHGSILMALLRRLGDAAFASALREVNAEARAAVGIALGRTLLPGAKFAGAEGIQQPLIGEAAFAQKFPLTYAALFPVPERVRYFMALAQQGSDARGAAAPPLHEEIVALGDAAAPALIEMLTDKRPVQVRIEPPHSGDNRFFSVIYLKAGEGGNRNSIADFAYFCLCRLREPAEGTYEQYEEYWRAALQEVIDGDGEISAAAVAACKAWWQRRAPLSGNR
ncbi:MAG: hypothetical protein N3A66_00065 [Planctomycetota bacterium]|nr:hypothetical protein [Planctomycetota bacterium]